MIPPVIKVESFQHATPEATWIFNFQIMDDSMVCHQGISFPPGAYIGVDFSRRPKHQDFVIAQISEKEAIFRQLIIENEKLFLHALNPSYPDREMKEGDRIYGVVCHLRILY